ncbi:hypothetical protein V6N13_092287 [Hibiscus sabdariffa]
MPLMPWATHVLQWTGQRVAIPRGHTAVNSFPSLVHTARHTTGAGHARSRYLNRKEGDAEGRASDWSEVVTRRIDGAIQVRSNVDPTFYSLVGSGRSGGDHHGSSLLDNPYIPYQCMDSYLSSTDQELRDRPFHSGVTEGSYHSSLFFHAFPGGPEKAAINRIFLILPSRKEEREILFPFRRDQEIGSSRAMIYFTGEVSGSSPGWPSCAKEKNRRSI